MYLFKNHLVWLISTKNIGVQRQGYIWAVSVVNRPLNRDNYFRKYITAFENAILKHEECIGAKEFFLLDVLQKHHPFLHVFSQPVVYHTHIHVPKGLILQPHLNILLHFSYFLFNCSISSLEVHWTLWKSCQKITVGGISVRVLTL